MRAGAENFEADNAAILVVVEHDHPYFVASFNTYDAQHASVDGGNGAVAPFHARTGGRKIRAWTAASIHIGTGLRSRITVSA